MGSRGPTGKPVELKVLEGNRGHRPLNLDQIFRPEVGVPDAPRYLSKEARKAWKRLSAELVHYNLLSKVDRDAFAMLCQTIGRLELIERSIAARQAVLEADGKDAIEALTGSTPKGMIIQGVKYQLLNREQGKLNALLKQFGLRPDARAAVTTAIRAQLTLFEGGVPAPGSSGAANESAALADGEMRGFPEFE